MIDVQNVRSAILNRLKEDGTPVGVTGDVAGIKMEFLQWLAQLRTPAVPEGESWEDRIRTFPPGDETECGGTRVGMRLALRFCTKANQYLLSIMECLASDGRGVHILTAHVNWKDSEYRLQKRLEEGYIGQFDDMLKAKHTIWVQTVRRGELHDALNSCAVAILGNELRMEPGEKVRGARVRNRYPKVIDFPGQTNNGG